MIARTTNELASIVKQGACVTIGNFDGVHLGHQRLLARVRDKARQKGLASVVITFDPHPLRVILGQTPPFITLIGQKLSLLEARGLDAVLCLEFTKDMAELSPDAFVAEYLVRGLNLKELIIGHDYAFGKNRAGNYEVLKRIGQEEGFSVERIEPVYRNGDVVSSTRIRRLIQSGRVDEARPLLGRCFQITGTVIEGQKRGGPILGIPTANLKLEDELFPKTGVYAVWAELEGAVYPAVANVGHNPTFGQNALSVEVHIFDFKQAIYDRSLRVHMVKRLRSEKRFSGIEELLAQIHRDMAKARDVLAQPTQPIDTTDEGTTTNTAEGQ
jgi:riboflavin kinase/FMN adenylyltransferase